jgi:thioredoxin reductase (NADPH)
MIDHVGNDGVQRPLLLAVDDDPGMLDRIERELRKRYGIDYEVVCAGSATAAQEALARCQNSGADIAVVLVDLGLWQTGPDLLAAARTADPGVRRVLMMDWGTPGGLRVLQQAAADGRTDDWIAKPWTDGDEHFHQGVSIFLYDWARQHRPVFASVRVVGERWSHRSHHIRDLLSRNSVYFAFHDGQSAEGRALVRQAAARRATLPLVVTVDGHMLSDPSDGEVMEALGLQIRPRLTHYDLAVIGAGPAGLAAAVSGASEGLRTVVLEQEALGGQAGSSSMIRNYLGFPRGVSGTELALRAYQQAGIFGAELVFTTAAGLRVEHQRSVVTLGDGSEISSRGVILATGVSYRRLSAPSLERLIGSGVFYGAAASEAPAMSGRRVVVVGGANSAGQAAVHLARYAADVTVVVRGSTLAQTMSDYLIREIDAAANITVRYRTEVVDAIGDRELTGIVVRSSISRDLETVPAAALFVLIGAEPKTSWLPADILRDRWGFILTGTDLVRDDAPPLTWTQGRPPLPFESSAPGVFAVGDVRHGSTKRVAAAVGEGSVAIRMVHEYLRQV